MYFVNTIYMCRAKVLKLKVLLSCFGALNFKFSKTEFKLISYDNALTTELLFSRGLV